MSSYARGAAALWRRVCLVVRGHRRLTATIAVTLAVSAASTLAVVPAPVASASPSAPVTQTPNPEVTTDLSSSICTAQVSSPSTSEAHDSWFAIGGQNEVEEVNDETGAVIGSPVPVGTDPVALAYWHPSVRHEALLTVRG